jgi:hypothetical protein
MIVQQSPATVLAGWPIGHQKPVKSSPSPGGEGWGEGELNPCGLMSALTYILTPDYWILNFSASSLLKVIKGYPSLLKPIFKNPFFMALQPESFNLQLSTPHSGRLRKAMVTYSNGRPPGGGVPMSTKPSNITNHRPHRSLSPQGEEWGLSRRSVTKADEGELNLRKCQSTSFSILPSEFWQCQPNEFANWTCQVPLMS